MSPSGSAPTQARFCAHSSTASIVPVYGIARDPPAVAVDRDRDRRVGLVEVEHRGVGRLRAPHGVRIRRSSRTARTPIACWRCSDDASRAEEGLARVRPVATRCLVSVDPAVGLCRLEVVERAVVDERDHRHLADHLAVAQDAEVAGVGDLADQRRRRSASARRGASTSSTFSGSTTASIRSCDSETMISNGSMSASRSGTLPTSMSIPVPPADAISAADEVSPAAPRSCSETSRSLPSSSRQHSSTFDSSNGSPIWTVGRFESSPVSRSAEASTEAPPIPSRPVDAPIRTTLLPTPAAAARTISSARASPTHIALTRQFCSYGGSK